MTEQTKRLLEATDGIREEYIEEAASPRRSRPQWVGFGAAAAVLLLLLGVAALFLPSAPDGEVFPFLAIRAYAADGSSTIIDELGDTALLCADSSPLFPGKEVYILDVYLENYTGDLEDLTQGTFYLIHKNRGLKPGEADESMAVEWLSREEDGFFGYRITGWCEERDYFELVIRDEDQKILHQKEVRIDKSEDYRANVQISYTYREDRTTDELIEAVMRQNYEQSFRFSSDLYQQHLLNNTGFRELTQRPDAARKLLDLFVRSKNGEQLFMVPSFWEDGAMKCNDNLLGTILCWDEFWDQLTRKEKELLVSYGVLRRLEDEGQKTIYEMKFPGKQIFFYELEVSADAWPDAKLEVSFPGSTDETIGEHMIISFLFSASWVEDQKTGWHIGGWFDEPTELTLTVRSGGQIARQDVLLITPTDDGYDITVLRTTE